MSTDILLLHGPNLNLLGTRQPEIYGSVTLDQINALAQRYAHSYDVDLRSEQSNHEGALVDILHVARNWADGVVFNPGAYTHTSVALRSRQPRCRWSRYTSRISTRVKNSGTAHYWLQSAWGRLRALAGAAISSELMRC